MSADLALQRRHRFAGVDGAAEAGQCVCPSRTAAATERGEGWLAAPMAYVATLVDWVHRHRHQDNAAPWRVGNQGHVVWVCH